MLRAIENNLDVKKASSRPHHQKRNEHALSPTAACGPRALQVLLNGRRGVGSPRGALSSLVPQYSNLMPLLTCRETMEFYEMVRRPSAGGHVERAAL